MSSDGLSEDLKIFFDEASEIFELLEGSLMSMERDGVDPEVVKEAFRAAHTIKGSSATAGFREMSIVTHHMENVLALARDGSIQVDTEVVDLMLSALDWLRLCKHALETGGDIPTYDDIISQLESLCSARAEDASRDSSKPALRSAERPNLPEDAAKITVWFKEDTPMLSVRMFQAILELEPFCKIESTSPSTDDLEADCASGPLVVLYSGSVDEEVVTKRLLQLASVERVTFSPAGAKAEEEIRDNPVPQKPAGTAVAADRQTAKTVRVDVSLIDSLMNLVGELIIDRTRLSQLVNDLASVPTASEVQGHLTSTVSHLYRISSEIQEGIMRARLIPLKNVLKKYPRMVRDLANKCGKQIEFTVTGEDTELDRSVIEVLDDPLIHLLRNSIDHGVESPDARVAMGKPPAGKVSIAASHQENHVIVVISDDGAGIDPEKVRRSAVKKGLMTEEAAGRLTSDQAIELVFTPGFSTAAQVNEVSGRGVGLDVVRSNLKRISGSVNIVTEPGKGTSFILRLPLTLAIVKALLVTSAGETYAIPVSSVHEVVQLDTSDVRTVAGREMILVRDKTYPLVRLQQAFGRAESSGDDASRYVAIVGAGHVSVAIGVGGLLGEQEIVVKSLSRILGSITGISGATILGQGDVALILDVHALVQSVFRARSA